MRRVRKIIHKSFISPIKEFINDSRAVGITLLCCTVVSLIVANSSVSKQYIACWNFSFHFPEPLHLPHTLLHWINDFLMAFFFFLVGMEIKRELLVGELSSVKKAIMPAAAALGGMLFPAIIYIIINKNSDYVNGWGIPMATDIAFSLGVASLLGKRVPVSLKIFLMALAIIDDLGAILVIALFYGEQISFTYLLFAAGICTFLGILLWLKKMNVVIIVLAGLLMWYCIFNSGIHATIAGVLLAMFIPVNKLKQYEHGFHKPVNFIFLPLFALANTAIIIQNDFAAAINSTLSWGVMLGLLVGKPVGITVVSWIIYKLGLGSKPYGVSWLQIFSIGILGAIGFTMSIFITMLALKQPDAQDISKIAVLIASVFAMVIGAGALLLSSKKKQ